LILPYRYSDRRTTPNEETIGARLASLIQQEVLFSMLKYESIGATELVSYGGKLCDVNDVIRMVTDPDNQRSVPVGGGLAIIWGRIYEEGDSIFVQSYVRFVLVGVDNTITVSLSTKDKPVELRATLPSQGVAMAPRRMTTKDFREIEARSARTLVLRDEPNEAVPSRTYPRGPHEPLTYWVVDHRGDWMRIKSQMTGEEGWVRARFDDEPWSLRRLLPELAYLDGVIGYLRLETKVGSQLRNGIRLRTWMETAFARYEREVGTDAAREAIALSRVLLGKIVWSQSYRLANPGAAKPGAELFREAWTLIPESSEARNLAAVTSQLLRTEYELTRESIAAINTGLLGAIAMDGRNLQALRNLENLYRYAMTQPELSTYTRPELEQRLTLLKEAQAAALRR
ncbi:MAG: hypothetical protein ACREYC_27280, partial [Gammaproteobacteria bacterium]